MEISDTLYNRPMIHIHFGSLRKPFMYTLNMLCLARSGAARWKIVVFDGEASLRFPS